MTYISEEGFGSPSENLQAITVYSPENHLWLELAFDIICEHLRQNTFKKQNEFSDMDLLSKHFKFYALLNETYSAPNKYSPFSRYQRYKMLLRLSGISTLSADLYEFIRTGAAEESDLAGVTKFPEMANLIAAIISLTDKNDVCGDLFVLEALITTIKRHIDFIDNNYAVIVSSPMQARMYKKYVLESRDVLPRLSKAASSLRRMLLVEEVHKFQAKSELQVINKILNSTFATHLN